MEVRAGRGSLQGSTSDIITEAAQGGDRFMQATFAASVMPISWEDRLKLKWGFSPAFLIEEAGDRQLLALESWHPADELALNGPANRRTLALRVVVDPAAGTLSLALLGKVGGASRARAEEAALALWRELQATFPYDYQLTPAVTKEAYLHLSGAPVLHSAAHVQEIRRFEGVLSTGQSQVYLLGRWQTSSWANEGIWRALAGLQAPSVYNVLLRPTVLYDFERMALAEMAQAAGAAANGLPHVAAQAQWAAQLHARRQSELRYPYMLQVHLASTRPIPDYLARAIGAALTHNPPGPNPPDPIPGFEAVGIEDADCRRQALDHLARLDPVESSPAVFDPRFQRLRWLMSAREALSAFRWPYPPENGLPGVGFRI
jgi:hypothetical protein